MIYYRISKWNGPEEIEVQRETEHFVILPNGRKQGKDTEYEFIRPSKKEAVEAIISLLQIELNSAIEKAKISVEDARKNLAKAERLREQI